MNNPKKKTSTAGGKVYEGMVELNDSYDVEESVTSSAVFDTPDHKKKSQAHAISGDENASPPTLLGPSAVETSADALDTSLVVDDMTLGVAAAPPPSASSQPPEEAPCTPQRKVSRSGGASPTKASASPSKQGSTNDAMSKIPTTITLPHSIDSSSSASGTGMPPLASPLGGEDDGEEDEGEHGRGDPKNRLLRIRTCNSRSTRLNASNSSSSEAAAIALKKRRRCLILTAMVAFVVLAAVAGTLGYLLGTSNDTSGGAGTRNSTSTSGNSSPDESSGAGNSPTEGQGGGGGQSNGGGSGVASTSSPVAAPTPPTPAPTQATDMYRAALTVTPRDVLEDPTTPQGMAIRWLLQPESSSATNVKYIPTSEDKLLQRYALTVMEMALNPNGVVSTSSTSRSAPNSSTAFVGGPVPGYEYIDECEWFGVTCATSNFTNASAATSNVTGMITTLNWANRNMEGRIPTEIGLLNHLETLDFGNNKLHGWIPYSIYNLTNLQYLYLHQNQLTGPISDKVMNLTQLIRFYAGRNQLTGTLPRGLGSAGRGAEVARPLRYLSLSYNKLGGKLPEDMYWYYMYKLDLSYNQFTGTFPVSWIGQMKKLSSLYIDFNRLTGSLPANFTYTIGSGRLQELLLSNNRFTGTFPGDFPVINFLQQLEFHHNNFTSLDSQLCRQIVFLGGELVNMKADCNVCTCDYYCGQNQCVSS